MGGGGGGGGGGESWRNEVMKYCATVYLQTETDRTDARVTLRE